MQRPDVSPGKRLGGGSRDWQNWKKVTRLPVQEAPL